MWERSVFCVISAFGIVFSSCASISWSSPELSKLDNEDGPLGRKLSTGETSWIGSLTTFGAMLGSFVGGHLANKLGRKLSIIVLAVPVTAAYLMEALASEVYLFYIARILNGLALGAFFGVMPLYVGEMARNEHRAMLSSLTALSVNAGTLVSYSLGPYVSVFCFNLVLASLPVIFSVIFFFVGLETPHYLLLNHKEEQARAVLRKMRGTDDSLAIKSELNFIEDLIAHEEHGTILDLFKSKAMMKSLFISVGLYTFQQCSAAIAVLSYTQQIFEAAGTSIPSDLDSIIFGVVQLFACFATPMILTRLGRKTLTVWSSGVMAIAEGTLGAYFILKDHTDMSKWSFVPILALGVYIIAYNNGLGTTPTIFLAEMFPNNVKASAVGISVTWCWFLGFIVSKYYSTLTDTFGPGACFVGFGIVCAVCVVFSQIFVIETKGKTLIEIQEELSR